MSTVQISDIYEPLTFNALVDEAAVEKNAFIQSGVMVDDERLTAQASAGGRIGDLANFAPLTNNEPNYSSDDNTSNSTPDNISGKEQKWRLAAMNRSWSIMQLAKELALKDPLEAVTSKIGGYWSTAVERRIIQSALGIVADNVANDSSDMVYSIATDSTDAITDAERISADAIVVASATAGDRQLDFKVIAMHSVPFATLRAKQLIDYERDADANVMLPYYLGMRVVVDDSLPAVAGTNRITYTTILFAPGAFGNGQGNVEMPSEVERKASSGDGGGETILHSRRSEIIHPYGMSFLSASVAAESATLAELAAAANWNRIYNRKNIQMAFLQTNG